MKKLLYILLIGTLPLAISSCNKDKEDDLTDGVEFPDKFSNLTPEQNKAKLEANGLEMIEELEDLKNSPAVEAVTSLSALFADDYEDEEEVFEAARLVRSLADFRNGSASASDVFAAMRFASDSTSDGPETVQELFDSYAGTHTWNASTEEWESTEGGSSVVFEFPAVEGDTENNAKLTFKDYQGVASSSPIDDYEGDLPANLVVELEVDGAVVLSYAFSASYNNDGEPTNVATSLTIGSYVFSVELTNTTSKAEADYSLKNGSKTLIAFGAGSSGNFTAGSLEDEEADVEDVVNDANAYFQLLNIKISGEVDVKTLSAKLDEIYENTTLTEMEAAELEAEAYNEYYELVVFYADTKEKIADTEFYAFMDTDSYWTWTGTEYEEVEYEYATTDIRLIFSDGSKSNFENYFGAGFEEFESEATAFFEDFE